MDIIPLSIASHFMCKECSLDLVFFMQIHSGQYDVYRAKWKSNVCTSSDPRRVSSVVRMVLIVLIRIVVFLVSTFLHS